MHLQIVHQNHSLAAKGLSFTPAPSPPATWRRPPSALQQCAVAAPWATAPSPLGRGLRHTLTLPAPARVLAAPPQVLEFAAFKDRLSASHTYLLARAEAVLQRMRAALTTPMPQPATAAATAACAHVADAWDALGFKEAAAAVAVRGARDAPPPPAQTEGQAPAAPLPVPLPLLPHTRFDEDLSTRPAWYPPLAAPAHLAPARWWELRAAGSSLQGAGVGWWAATASAEAPHPQVCGWELVHALRSLLCVFVSA